MGTEVEVVAMSTQTGANRLEKTGSGDRDQADRVRAGSGMEQLISYSRY